MPITDREAFNAAWRRWYRKNAARKMEWQRRRQLEIRAWWAALKATKSCERCGERAPECLQFHHIDRASKDIELSIAASRGWSKQRILAEIEKCEVLCANCHLIHHWNERQKEREK